MISSEIKDQNILYVSVSSQLCGLNVWRFQKWTGELREERENDSHLSSFYISDRKKDK